MKTRTVENNTVRLPQLGPVSIRKTNDVMAVKLDAVRGPASLLRPGDTERGNADGYLDLPEANRWAQTLREANTVGNLPWFSRVFRTSAALQKKANTIDAALDAVELLVERAERALAAQKLTPAERATISSPLTAEIETAARNIENLRGEPNARYSREARWAHNAGGTRYDEPSDAGVSFKGASSQVYSDAHTLLERVAQALWEKGALEEGNSIQTVANAFQAAGKKVDSVGSYRTLDTTYYVEVTGMSKSEALGYLRQVSDILSAWTSVQ